MIKPSTPTITAGLGGMPKVCLSAADGARADIYLHGAHVTAWVPAGGEDRLFLSPKSQFSPGEAIRGGVPVIFPQFSGLGPLPKHGFARTLPWELISLSGDPDSASAELMLIDSESTRLIWHHRFQANVRIVIGGVRMALSFTIRNTGDDPFSFTAALHTYLRVENILTTAIHGLQGLHYLDTVNRPTPADWVDSVQAEPEVHFPGEVDRVYLGVSQPLRVCEPGRITQVTAEGFTDAVIWNPGPGKTARLADMEPEGYRQMVCVEAAIASKPVTLSPGATWQGTQVVSAG
jgi:glucose-6-phosphate 1-epimerase